LKVSKFEVGEAHTEHEYLYCQHAEKYTKDVD